MIKDSISRRLRLLMLLALESVEPSVLLESSVLMLVGWVPLVCVSVLVGTVPLLVV